jgi:hypothetical protein
MVRFAAIYLDSAAYNAAKHGLGIAAGAARLAIDVDGETIMEGGGETIAFLDRRSDGGKGGLGMRTKWIDPDHSIALIAAGCHLIRQLWVVGRWRYLGDPPQGFQLMDRLSLSDVDAGRLELGIENMTMNFDIGIGS